MSDFKIALREAPNVQIIDVAGYLDAHTAPLLENTFSKLIEEQKYKLIVNFTELNYISSAGLGVFMAYIEKIRNNSGDIKMTNLKDKIFNIFDMIGFPLLYEIYSNEIEAVNKFNIK